MSWLARQPAGAVVNMNRRWSWRRRPTSWRKSGEKDPCSTANGIRPIALGAAIEVQAQAMASAASGSKRRRCCVRDLLPYGKTSLAARLQKNLNLLTLRASWRRRSLERFLGPKPESLSALAGKPVLLFSAHWCGDCKATTPVIAPSAPSLPGRALSSWRRRSPTALPRTPKMSHWRPRFSTSMPCVTKATRRFLMCRRR